MSHNIMCGNVHADNRQTLEQLIGSQSVFSSLERQFGLRRIDLLGATIIAAWLLSPLRGQASLRLLSTRISERHIEATVHYHAVDAFVNKSMLKPHMEEYNWPLYAPLFMSALQFARRNYNESRDLFGNIRIPDMASLTVNAPTPDHEWYNVTGASSFWYTSLLGRPVVDVPSSGNLTFMIESSYWEVHCGAFTDSVTFEDNKTIPGTIYTSSPYIGRVNQGWERPSFDLVQYTEYTESSGNNTRLVFKYVTRVDYNAFKYSNCTATLRNVESAVSCQAGTCDVQRMRTSTRGATSLSEFITSGITYAPFYFSMLCEFFPGTDSGPNLVKASEMVEQWIGDPSLSEIISNWGGWPSSNHTTLSPEIFSRRFQIALNTFWDSSMGFNYMAMNATSHFGDYNDTISAPWTAVDACGTDHDTEKYVCNITFAIITILISLLLFVAAATSAFLGSITKAPDILGYVSTLARDDPYFGKAVPSYHDGLQAARALRDVRVMIGDVQKDSEVGHIAFAASKEIDAKRVSKKRVYD